MRAKAAEEKAAQKEEKAKAKAKARNPQPSEAGIQQQGEEISQLLKRSKDLRPEMVRVVLTAVSSQKRRLQQDDADFVLDYNNLNRLLPQILKEIQGRNLDSISSE